MAKKSKAAATEPAEAPDPFIETIVNLAGLTKVRTPTGIAYLDARPGNIEIISAPMFYTPKGRPSSTTPPALLPGRWITTKNGNKLFVLAVESNRNALGLGE